MNAAAPLTAPSLWRRMACWLYEGFLLFATLLIATLLFSVVGQMRSGIDSLRPLLITFLAIVGGMYCSWFWSKGQTLPMRVWHIRMVDRLGRPVTQAHVGGAVVERIAPALVEPYHHVQRPDGAIVARARGVRLIEMARQCAGRHRDLAHAALHEVAAQDRLGEVHHVRQRGHHAQLREHIAQARHVRRIISLLRMQLGDGDRQ